MIKIVDLDRSPSNKIVTEFSYEGCVKMFECPHHIIVGIIKIIGEVVRQARLNEQPSVLQKKVDTGKIIEDLKQYLMKEFIDIKNEIQEIKMKM